MSAGRALGVGDRIRQCHAGELRAGMTAVPGRRALTRRRRRRGDARPGVLAVELLGRGRVILEAGALVWVVAL